MRMFEHLSLNFHSNKKDRVKLGLFIIWGLPPPFNNSRKEKGPDLGHLSDSYSFPSQQACRAEFSQKLNLNLGLSLFLFLSDGGGEIRTLVLSKLYNNAYMLSPLIYSASLAVRNPTKGSHTSFNLETLPLEVKRQCSCQDL